MVEVDFNDYTSRLREFLESLKGKNAASDFDYSSAV
jgi:hypothetical protein